MFDDLAVVIRLKYDRAKILTPGNPQAVRMT